MSSVGSAPASGVTDLRTGDPAVDELHAELRRLRLALAISRHEYHELLSAARAAAAAAARGEHDPLVWIVEELAAHGQLPETGSTPQCVAAAPTIGVER